jgi:hypothetical protein
VPHACLVPGAWCLVPRTSLSMPCNGTRWRRTAFIRYSGVIVLCPLCVICLSISTYAL